MAKKYSKYAKEFKQELDLRKKDYEQYAKMKSNISQYDNKLREIKDEINEAQVKRDGIEKEIKEFERELYHIQQIENEFNFLTMTLQDKHKQLEEINQRLHFEDSVQG